jgi:hypothetical protein
MSLPAAVLFAATGCRSGSRDSEVGTLDCWRPRWACAFGDRIQCDRPGGEPSTIAGREAALGAFYSAQLGSPAFFGYMSAIVFLNVVSRRADLGEIFAAFSAGWRAGQHCAPMFGIAWDELWDTPLAEVRSRFQVDRSEIVGEGIRVAA